MNSRIFTYIARGACFTLVAVLLVSIFSVVLPPESPLVGKASAVDDACSTASVPTPYGTADQTVTVNVAGSYRVWNRVMAPSDTANSLFLRVDDACVYTIGDSTQIPVNDWTWVNYRDGNSLLPLDIDLTAGSHKLTFIGREADVQLDKVMLLADKTCVPAGIGDNCSIVDTTAPVVTITSPAADSKVSGTVAVTASVYDLSEITKVEYYVDGQLASTTGPGTEYSYAWDTTTVANGQHALQVKAYDDAFPANVGTSSTVTVVTSNKPAIGALVTQSSLIVDKATVAPGDTIQATAVYKNNSEFPVTVNDIRLSARSPDGSVVTGYFAAATQGPYTVEPGATVAISGQHTTGADDKLGTYWAYSEYIDTAGTVHPDATETSFMLAIPDTSPPLIALTSPAEGAQVTKGSALAISVDASDNTGVSKVEILIDGQLKASLPAAPYVYSWDTAAVAEGPHSITAKAYDAAGNMAATQATNVTVLQPPDTAKPTVSITSPAAGASITIGTTATIAASASDNVKVTKVEFYVDGSLKGSAAAAPFSYTWNTTGVSAGSHAITAKAYDAAGNSATTPATTVTLVAAPGTGLAATYYNNENFTGTTFSRTDAVVNFDWGKGSPNPAIAADTFSARWTGYVKPTKTETYTFYTTSDDGVRLWINGVQLVNNWTAHSTATNSGKINLTAGQKYTIKMEYYEKTNSAIAKLLWSTPTISQQVIPQSQLYPN